MPQVFILIAYLFTMQPALGQSTVDICDPSLLSVRGVLGYAFRKTDSRCEGIYESPVSASGMKVVSVTLGRLEFNVDRDEGLVISLPDLSGLDIDAVRIRAVALPVRVYYRMDARLVVGETLHWPIGEVVGPLGLSDEQLGVYGWADRGGERIIIPVAVTREGSPNGGQEAVIITLRSHTELEHVVWRTISAEGIATPFESLIDERVHGGDPIQLTLPPGSPGIIKLDLRGKWPDSDEWQALRFNAWRPGL